MKKILFTLLVILFVKIGGYSQNWKWIESLSGTGGDIETFSTAIDSNEDIYVLGSFEGSIKNASGTLIPSLGGADLFIAKFSIDGTLIWMRLAQGAHSDRPIRLIVGANNEIYVTGNTTGNITFQDATNPITVNHTVPGTNKLNVFLAKYNSNGDLQWAKNAAGGTVRNMVQSIYYDKVSDEIIMTSIFMKEAILSPSDTLHPDVPNKIGFFVAKLSTNGDYISHKQYGSPAPGVGRAMFNEIRRLDNNYYLSGTVVKTIDMGNGPITSQGPNDFLLCKTDLNFNTIWTRVATGAQKEFSYSLSVTHSGILIGGYSQSPTLTFNLPGGDQDLDLSTPSTDGFLARYALDGSLVNKTAILSDSDVQIYSSYYGENNLGKVTYTGSFKGTLIAGQDTLTSANPTATDVFWMVADTNNTILYASQTEGSGSDKGYSTIINSSGEAIVAGYFKSDPITFPSRYGQDATLNVSDVGFSNGFLAKYSLCSDYDVRFFIDSVSCPTSNDGSLTALVFRDTTNNADTIKYNWNYVWSTGETTDSIENLSAQSYYLTLTNRYGCEYVDSVEVTHKRTLITQLTDTVTLNCESDLLASDTVFASFGNRPYAYAWSSGVGSFTDSVAYDLPVGIHTVTVTDACGISVVDSISVGHLPVLQASINTHSALITCEDGTDGEAWIQTSDGYGTITYAWENSSSTDYLASDLNVGLHHVTISDGCGSIIDSVNVVNLPGMNIDITNHTNVTCSGLSDGTAEIFVAGGVEPYTYNWSSGETTANPSGLSEGWNYITVTDVCGSTTDSVLIGVETAMNIQAYATHETCSSGNGSVFVEVTGGSGSYSYLWDTNPTSGTIGTNDTITGLSANMYYVTVTDACGSKVDSVELTNTPQLQASLVNHSLVLNCENSTNGSASLIVSNGVEPYTFNWSSSPSTTSTANNLGVGVEYVTVTDACGTFIVDSIDIGYYPKLITQANYMSDASCSNSTDGKASVTAIGGVQPYTYAWSNGTSTSNIATDLPAGITYVTVTDFCGSVIDSVEVAVKPELEINVSADNATCADSNGTVYANATKGIAPYTFVWDTVTNPANPPLWNGNTVTGLPANMYYVTVTDACGSKVDSIEITTNLPLQASLTSHSEVLNCENSTNGSASLIVSNGVQPYTFVWSTSNSTTSTASNLGVGIEYVTVTDACGTSIVDSIDIGHYPKLITQTNYISDASCSNSTDGKASVTAIGGVQPYTYAWSNGTSTSNVATDLPAGITYVTVTDFCGSVIDSVEVAVKPELEINVSADNATCADSNGTVYVNATNGVTPYTFVWDTVTNPANPPLWNGNTVTGLPANMYYVTVTDACGSKVDSIEITTNLPLQASLTSHSEVLNCENSTNGSASLIVSNGVQPYTFVWSTSNSTTATANNLGVGVEYVTVTDACGTSIVDSIDIGHYPKLITQTNYISDASCSNSNDGKASVTAIGGVQPYTYAWSNGTSTSNVATDLPIGKTYVTVTDFCGSVIDSVEVDLKPELEINVGADNATCANSNGTVYVNATNGVTPYTFAWDTVTNPANPPIWNGSNVTGLSADMYYVTVTDACGSKVDSIEITTNLPLQASLTSHSEVLNCENSTNGSASLIVNNGVQPYTFVWSTSSSTTSTTGNLGVGVEYVTVTDACGTSIVDSIDIGHYPKLITQTNYMSDASCPTSNDGKASVTAIGGVQPYTYAWSNGTSTSNVATDLPIGKTYVTVTDFCGSVVDSVEVAVKPELEINVGADNATCANSNGTVYVNATNGVTPYTFAWDTVTNPANSPIWSSSNVTGLSADMYYVTVTDACGSKVDSIEITTNLPLQASLASHSEVLNCENSTNGSASLIVNNGVQPYTFVWSTSNSTTATANNLGIGVEYVTVVDACGTVIIDSIDIGYYPKLIAYAEKISDASCSTMSNGKASVLVTGGVQPYSYVWSNDTSTSNTASGLPVGTTYVTVTDLCGTAVDSVTIDSRPEFAYTFEKSNNICYGDTSGYIKVNVTDGMPPYSYNWGTLSTADTNYMDHLVTGWYPVTITDQCNNPKVDSVLIESAAALMATMKNTTSTVMCENSTSGRGEVIVNGGVPPYTYLWSNGETTYNANTLTVGTHYVSVTDMCLDTIVDSTYIVSISPMNVDVDITQPLCFNEENGSIRLYVNQGIQPYQVSWSHTSNDNLTQNNLSSGWYRYTVSDQCGSVSDSIELLNPNPISINADISNESQVGFIDGSILLTITGGTEPYVFSWNNGSFEKDLYNVPRGIYTIKVEDNNNCSTSATYEISSTAIPITTMDAFTPNGDGVNEEWLIENIGKYPDCVVKVFNQWGNLVFESKGYNDPWDGTHDGKKVDAAVYYYVIDLNNDENPRTGSVTIMY